MRARWGHTSPVGRPLPALISDKGLSVPRTPALPHRFSPATTSLSKPPLITRPRADTGAARPGGGQELGSLRPIPHSAAKPPCTPTHRCTPTPPAQDTDQTEGYFGRAPLPSPGHWAPTGLPTLPTGLWNTGVLQVCSETQGGGSNGTPKSPDTALPVSPLPLPSSLLFCFILVTFLDLKNRIYKPIFFGTEQGKAAWEDSPALTQVSTRVHAATGLPGQALCPRLPHPAHSHR